LSDLEDISRNLVTEVVVLGFEALNPSGQFCNEIGLDRRLRHWAGALSIDQGQQGSGGWRELARHHGLSFSMMPSPLLPAGMELPGSAHQALDERLRWVR